MIRSLALTVFLVATLLGACAQNSPIKPSSVAGTIVKEPGSQPLKKVLLQLIAENQTNGGTYTASTDADGHFNIENISPGRYRIFLDRPGFVGVNERGVKSDTNVFTVHAGQSLSDLLFRMSPTAVISGRVSDEDGDPMSGVRVLALAKIPGKTKRTPAATGTTNDLGEYRLPGLFAGQYFVVAMPSPDFRDYELSAKQNESKADTRYLTTYYPGTYDAAQAAPLSLKPGDEVPVNLSLAPAKTYRVRGTIAGLAAKQKAIVELVSKTGESIHLNEVGADGQFDLHGVGPGTYTLRASSISNSQLLTAPQEINVVAADLEGVKLAAQHSFQLSGHLRLEDGSTAELTQYTVNLRASEVADDPGLFLSQEFMGSNTPVDRQGNFQWKDVYPGNYIVQLYGGDQQESSFLKSIKLAGRDIETGFTANAPATLDIIVSSHGGTIEGTVKDRDEEKTSEQNADGHHPVANATVVAVPEEKYRNLPGRFGIGETDQMGRFSLRGLPPGNYLLFAWQDVEENVYRDPEFLKSEEANGVPMKVEENSHLTMDLKLSPISKEWQ